MTIASERPTGPAAKPIAPNAEVERTERRFARDETGAAAVEFALVAPLLIAMIFMILETGAIYWVDRALQSYASDVARLHRTGFVRNVTAKDASGNTITRAEDLCRDRWAGLFFDCNKIELHLDVRETSKLTPLRDGSGKLKPANFKVDAGPSGTVNIVRVYYEWSRMVRVPISATGKPMDNGDIELYAAAGFVTE